MSPTQFSVDLRALKAAYKEHGASPHPRYRGTADQFLDVIRNDRFHAAQCPETFAFASQLVSEDPEKIVYALNELIACYPAEVAQNQFAGGLIAVMIENSRAADVINTLGFLAHHFPREFASNASMINALAAGASAGYTKRAATLLRSLSKEAPLLLASNPCLGLALTDVATTRRGQDLAASVALQACSNLAESAPQKLAINKSALVALEKLRAHNVNAVFAIEAKIAPFRDQSQRIVGTRTFRHG